MLKRCLITAVFTLILLELTLQLGSVVVWASNRSPRDAPVAEGHKTVLCIGDSFTFGQGSSSREFAYPAQLESRLRKEVDSNWTVINGGYPGRNSRDLLERIQGQLEQYSPDFVYVIVGINDQWTKPDLLELSDAASSAELSAREGSYRWELRTWRMLQWMSGGLLREDEPVDLPPLTYAAQPSELPPPKDLVGKWSNSEISIDIGADGELRFGAVRLRFTADEATLQLISPDASRVSMQWRREGNDLLLFRDDSLTMMRLHGPSMQPLELYERGNAAEKAGRIELAQQYFEQAIASDPADANPFWIVARVRCLTLLERREDVIQVIQDLRTRYSAEGSADLAAAICSSLSQIGDREECVAEARRALERFPDNPFLLQIFAWQSFLGGDQEKSIPIMEKAVRESEDTNPAMRRFTRYLLARMLSANYPQRAIEVIADLFQQEEAEEQVLTVVHNVKKFTDLELVEATLPGTDLSTEEQAELLRIFRASYLPKSDVFSTLEAHLEQIVNLASQSGASVVLSSYPWHNQEISAVHASLLERTRAKRMSMAPDFQTVLQTTKRSDLFVADGHCNDRGYGIMADAVFSDLMKRLGR